jgi:hypothetical protein
MKNIANNKVVGVVALTLALLLLTFSFVFTAVDRDTLAETMPALEATSPIQVASVETSAKADYASAAVTDDVLWLARVIYSETKEAHEQELVAWVVRNRVETKYRGASTYKGVVLDPWQFSAFNNNSPKRKHYSTLKEDSQARGWQTAIEIAKQVVHAPAQERPFAVQTRHFYSERSMVGRKAPAWANGQRPVSLDRPVDPRRFRFFSGIA